MIICVLNIIIFKKIMSSLLEGVNSRPFTWTKCMDTCYFQSSSILIHSPFSFIFTQTILQNALLCLFVHNLIIFRKTYTLLFRITLPKKHISLKVPITLREQSLREKDQFSHIPNLIPLTPFLSFFMEVK